MLRHLPKASDLFDFSSNDYLGFSRNGEIFQRASQILAENNIVRNGSTGSRLLSGNHPLYSELEEKLAEFHQAEAALVFNSGYDANIGFFGAVPQRGDIVLYDEYIHASIRDGIKMGNAKSYKFKHNDLQDLKKKCRAKPALPAGRRSRSPHAAEVPVLSLPAVEAGAAEVYVVTESVFSVDGDSPDLKTLSKFCQENNYNLVVDEAHAVGVFGNNGEGLIQELGLQDALFARIVTFGKAMGCHGAAILGSMALKDYLVNFARSLIYTTGLPPHSVATIMASYEHLSSSQKEDEIKMGQHPVLKLRKKIELFNRELSAYLLETFFIQSNSAIHCCILPGNERVRSVAEKIAKAGFDVKAIRSPTVPQGQERLRICLHNFNTEKEITEVLRLMAIFTIEA